MPPARWLVGGIWPSPAPFCRDPELGTVHRPRRETRRFVISCFACVAVLWMWTCVLRPGSWGAFQLVLRQYWIDVQTCAPCAVTWEAVPGGGLEWPGSVHPHLCWLRAQAHPTRGPLEPKARVQPMPSCVPSCQPRGFCMSQNIRIGFAVHFGEQINLFLYLTVVKSWDFESL